MNTISSRLFSRGTLLSSALMLSSLAVQAQPPVQGAASTSFEALKICDVSVCPSGTIPASPIFLEVSNTPTSLNVDMTTVAADGTGGYNDIAAYGISPGAASSTLLFGAAYSGITNTDNPTPYSGITINTYNQQIIGSPFSAHMQKLPHPALGMTVADDPDIAIGTSNSGTMVRPNGSHFALVVYTTNTGDLLLERHSIEVLGGGIVSVQPGQGGLIGCAVVAPPPLPFACTASTFYVHMLAGFVLTDPTPGSGAPPSHGRNSKPRIDLWNAPSAVATSSIISKDMFIVTFEKYNNNTSTAEIWAVTGTTDLSTINPPFKVADGQQPDVVAVTAGLPYSGPAAGLFRAYISYLNSAADEIHVKEVRYNSLGLFLTRQMNSSTVSPGTFSTPRIAGPKRYDYLNPASDDPLCVVVANDATNAPYDGVSAFKLYHPSLSLTPVDEMPDFSNYSSDPSLPLGFSGNSQTAIMPVVSGVGKLTASLGAGAPYRDYVVGFYSDHDNNNTPETSGDFYAFGIDMNMTNLTQSQPGTNYMEVNLNPLAHTSSYFTMAHKPILAIATANNTGYDLLSAYYAGDKSSQQKIITAFHGIGVAPYSFKGGNTTSVTVKEAEGFATYPNPVSNVLNITKANGADFTLINQMGQTLNFGRLDSDKATISTASLMSGTYIITITKNGHTEKVKFVKQ